MDSGSGWNIAADFMTTGQATKNTTAARCKTSRPGQSVRTRTRRQQRADRRERVEDLPCAGGVVEAEPFGELDSQPADSEETGWCVVTPGATREATILHERLS